MLNRIIVFLIISILLSFPSNLAYAQEDAERGTGIITGRVISVSNKGPIPGITVRVLDTKLGGFTNPDGKFTIKNVEPGTYAVQFSGVGYETYVQTDVRVNPGKPRSLKIELAEKIIELEGAEVRSSYFQKRVETASSTQTLNSEDIRRAPGVQEDVVRATALLPGVAVTAAGRNDLIVRGGAPFENLFVVDGIEIPNINHFGSQGASGGPLSIINIDFVRNVNFSAGGFGARYGDKVSSLTEINLRNGNEERFAGLVNLSATGFGANVEGPVGEKGSFFFSARRSYLDLLFKLAGFAFIPQYWDFQGKLNYRLDDENSLEFLAIGALDEVTLNNDDEDNKFSNSQVAIPNQNQYFSGITWQTLFDKGFGRFTIGRTWVDFNTFQNDSNLATVFENRSTEGETSFNAIFDFQLTKKSELKFGNILKYASQLDYNVLIPGFLRRDNDGNPVPLAVDTSFTAIRNGTFASYTLGLGQDKLTFSGRMDYYNFIDNNNLVFSPRASYIYQLNPVSALTLTAGRFYQAPSYVWLIGAPEQDLKPIRADQIIFGYDHTPLEDVKVQVEVYYKWYADYPGRVWRPQAVLAPSGFDDITSDIPFGLEPLSSNASGYSRGFEIFIQKKLSKIPLYGLFSFTFSESKFNSLDGEDRFSAYDSRIITNLAAGYRFNPVWEVSAKFRLATGQPTTPFNPDGTLDFTQYNEGDRLPVFHALDVRVDKRWNFSNIGLITYIDIQNIYGRANISGVRWDRRNRRPEFNESIGLLPSIGLQLEF